MARKSNSRSNMARMNKKRGSRGDDWERLKVSGKIIWADRRLYNRLSTAERSRVRLTVMLDTLESGSSTLGRMGQVTWSNPDAPPGTGKRGMPSGREDYHSVTVRGGEIAGHLPTLNRGNWLAAAIRYELAKMGGPYRESLPPVERTKKARRKPRRKG